MNILAIDYGTKNIGLAWADTAMNVVLPFGVVKNFESGILNLELVDIIKKEKIGKLIVGLPIHAETREETANSKRVRAFVEELKKQIDIPVEFVDETFTTHEAKQMGGEASLDEKAAMLILEDYLSK